MTQRSASPVGQEPARAEADQPVASPAQRPHPAGGRLGQAQPPAQHHRRRQEDRREPGAAGGRTGQAVPDLGERRGEAVALQGAAGVPGSFLGVPEQGGSLGGRPGQVRLADEAGGGVPGGFRRVDRHPVVDHRVDEFVPGGVGVLAGPGRFGRHRDLARARWGAGRGRGDRGDRGRGGVAAPADEDAAQGRDQDAQRHRISGRIL